MLSIFLERLHGSPVFQTFLKDLGVERAAQIHHSLGCYDRIAALIREERLFKYPAGTDLAGEYRLGICATYTKHKLRCLEGIPD